MTPANLIAGRAIPIPGDALVSRNPADPSRVVYSCAPDLAHVDAAVHAARAALPPWSRTPREQRFAALRAFAALAKQHAGRMADALCDEVGKVMWEAKGEASILAGKVDITLDPSPEGGLRRITDFSLPLSATRTGHCHFRPHGVMAVLGPFNFPAHLPNGHIVPALAAGNTVVFKPSDKTPLVGQLLAELFDEALREVGAPPGVVNLIQGGPDIAAKLVAHPGVDAIAFTGSWPVARRILEANLDRPGRVCALELGGSNPAIVMPDADLRLAAVEIVRSAFATTGQRCTCTRRLIVHESLLDRLVPAVCKAASTLIFGDPRAAYPVFAGPVVNDAARASALSFQAACRRAGARVLVESTPLDRPGSFLTPSVIEVDRFIPAEPAPPAPAASADPFASPAFDPGQDTEIFGPLLRIAAVRSLDEAIAQANATRYGLAASIFTSDPAAVEAFLHDVKAGCLNVNTGTAGASSKLPFGGLGLSGNHRPAGSFALDYCAYPVAGMVESSAQAALPEGMRFDDAWLR